MAHDLGYHARQSQGLKPVNRVPKKPCGAAAAPAALAAKSVKESSNA